MRPTSSRAFLQGVNFEVAEGDLRDVASLERAVTGVDYVFHVAGCVTGLNREEFMAHNAEGTASLGQAVARAAPGLKRFVYVSSVAAVGPAPGLEPLTEDCEPRPISHYGASKLAGEVALCRLLGSIPLSILRPPPVYGPRDRGIFQIIKVLNRGIAPRPGSERPGVEKHYNFIYVDDLVAMTIAAALTPGQDIRETYFAVGDESYSWSRILKAVQRALGRERMLPLPMPLAVLGAAACISEAAMKVTGRRFELTLDKYKEMRPDYYVYSNARARSRLSFVEQVKIDEGMKRAVEWYRQQGWL